MKVYRQTPLLTCTHHELHFAHVLDATCPEDRFQAVSLRFNSLHGGM